MFKMIDCRADPAPFSHLKGTTVSSSRTSSVRSQLRLTFAIIIVLSFVSTAVAIWRLQVLANDTRALTERPLATERLISSWLTNTSVGVKRTAVITRAADPGLGKLYAEEIGRAHV